LESTTFAVIDANNTIIAGGALPLYNSIFVAEATAILLACRFATSKNGEFVVCTDSLSSLLAINNPEYRDPTIREIQRLTKEHPKKITLFWVPSHQGIKGNEDADQAAHNIGLSPTFIFTPINSKDIHKLIDRNLENQNMEEWSTFTHRYCKFNPTCTKIPLPAAIGRRQCSTFIRLRIGHTKHTHEHLLKGINNPICSLCGGIPNTDHLLDNCPGLANIRAHLFGTQPPSQILDCPSVENIKKIYEFISKSKLAI